MKGIVIISVVELLASVFAIKSKNLHFIRAIIVINMVLISLFAPLLIGYAGFVSNVGNIFYATVVGLQMYILMHYGKKEATETINKIVFVLFTLSGIYLGLNLLHCFPVPEGFCSSVKLLTNQSPLTLLVAVFAFIIGQLSLIKSYEIFTKKINSNILCAFFAIVVAQFVDSVVFFGIAFNDFFGLLQIMIVGFVFKVLLALVTLPVLKLK